MPASIGPERSGEPLLVSLQGAPGEIGRWFSLRNALWRWWKAFPRCTFWSKVCFFTHIFPSDFWAKIPSVGFFDAFFFFLLFNMTHFQFFQHLFGAFLETRPVAFLGKAFSSWHFWASGSRSFLFAGITWGRRKRSLRSDSVEGALASFGKLP